MKIAVVGATGLVGSKMLQVLEERNFPVTELIPVASEKSVGKKIIFRKQEYTVVSMQDAINRKPAVAIFSAGGNTSLEWAPKFAAAGITVIDNSSAWRMDPSKKLVIPEINAHLLTVDDKIIANPNCSTIQMLVALAPLHRAYKIKRLVISTYQSVTGTGVKALRQLEAEEVASAALSSRRMPGSPLPEPGDPGIRRDDNPVRAGLSAGPEVSVRAYPHQIHRNCIPQCDVFTDNGYTKEEMKMVNETRKILGDDSIMATATTVRVPVVGGHSEAVNIEFHNEYDINDIRKILSEAPGCIVQDDPSKSIYPMALTAHERDEVFVGRIRRDESQPKSLNLWIVSDNLRKGAATNAVQIAEYLISQKLV
ncbi:MAG: aspartate-semialdehyde dehydrogenase [Bacteroidetes bacterium GWF2_49_14]|nr:MAG: aspartate-semialdehyde dehydrogenase [Bacteroidetes bacterium GWF2_49_14]HBB92643.1 aspartate-semialdehyde dehydrogenase [Bacteroidales bacterium]